LAELTAAELTATVAATAATNGKRHVTSSVTGILTATDPLFTALLTLWLIRSEAVGCGHHPATTRPPPGHRGAHSGETDQ
jgi:hypothetical protein